MLLKFAGLVHFLLPASSITDAAPQIQVRYLTSPKAIAAVSPSYSREAKIAELEGTVTLAGTVTVDGSISQLRVIDPLGLGLDEAAQAAAGAWSFQPGTTADGPYPMLTTISLNFVMQNKTSHWHLLRAVFDTPGGATRPQFARASYPARDHVNLNATEENRMVAALGRMPFVRLSFEVALTGRPAHFKVQNASAPIWGREAVSFVSQWTFIPGSNNNHPVTIPCSVDLFWGERKLTESSLTAARHAFTLFLLSTVGTKLSADLPQ